MSAATADLQKAMFSALTGSAALVALLGGAKVFDHAPANVAFPYITFGRASAYDWSTSTEKGSEHFVTLNCWSREKGRREIFSIMDAARNCLDEAALTLAGNRLVALRLEFSEARFDDDLAVHQGVMRLRAVIEHGS